MYGPAMTWLHDKTDELLKRVNEVKEKRAFPFFRPFENIGSRVRVGRGSYINFTSNDYLGLSQSPRLIKPAQAGTAAYGTGLGSARLQAHSVRHELLEQRQAVGAGPVHVVDHDHGWGAPGDLADQRSQGGEHTTPSLSQRQPLAHRRRFGFGGGWRMT